MKGTVVFLSTVVLALMAGCARDAGEQRSSAERLDRERIVASVVEVADLDADPCQDFYRYACGSWLDGTEIPADQSRWTRFNEMYDRTLERLRGLLEEFDSDPDADPGYAGLGTFYGACMDEEAVEALGMSPLEPWLAEIEQVNGARGFLAVVGRLHAVGIDALFEPSVEPDFLDPDVNIAHISQGGLGLPDRDYYLSDGARFEEIRAAYREHVAAMLVLVGATNDDAARQADAVIRFETALAEASLPRAELRDPEKTYHKLDFTGLQELAPGLDWGGYLEALGRPGVQDINVAVPRFFEALDTVLGDADRGVLRAYLRWTLIDAAAPYLTREAVSLDFSFRGRTLRGQQEIQPRWKRCVNVTDGTLGQWLGRAFVERYFPGESKDVALDMIRGIEAAFEESLPRLAWMDDTTRDRASGKLHALTNKVGYPDRWRDFGEVEIEAGRFFGNVLAAEAFEVRRNVAKIGQPVDRGEWYMSPPTVNAYYSPLGNEMVFPAGILQPPFFHLDFPAAMRFGGVGVVMGHELTHGFDDSGRKFDPKGRMVEWWEPEASAAFEERSECIRDQYSGYEVQPGVGLDGALTLGENIADLGGLKQAHLAYKAWERENQATEPIVEGLTNDQLFFVAYAQLLCAKVTPEAERIGAKTDPHSPPRLRVFGPASNSAAFAEAFQCGVGTPMNPEEQCEVW